MYITFIYLKCVNFTDFFPKNLLLFSLIPPLFYSVSFACMLSRVQLFVTTRNMAARVLCPWHFPGKNIGAVCHFLLLGIFPTKGLNLCLLLDRWFFTIESSGNLYFISVKLSHSCGSNYLQPPWTAALQASCPSPTPEPTQTHVHQVGDAIQLSHPLSSPSPHAFCLSQHQVLFQWVSSHQVAKILEFQIQHQSFQWIYRTGFLRMDWLDRLAVQGTLKSLLQHHSSKASMLRCSAFFIVQLSHPYMSTAKTIALTKWIFVGIVMSLLFNMLSRLI